MFFSNTLASIPSRDTVVSMLTSLKLIPRVRENGFEKISKKSGSKEVKKLEEKKMNEWVKSQKNRGRGFDEGDRKY